MRDEIGLNSIDPVPGLVAQARVALFCGGLIRHSSQEKRRDNDINCLLTL